MTAQNPSTPTELADLYGRGYRVGLSDRQLLGHSRRRIFWLCCLLMAAAGLPQYGFALLLAAVVREHHWSGTGGLTVLATFVIVQAAVAYPTAYLREHDLLPARSAILFGGMLCAAGLIGAGHSQAWVPTLLAYGVCGGIGAGLMYATALAMVAHWYPERSSTRIGMVVGAFAFGVVPPSAVLLSIESPSTTVLFDMSAIVILVITLGAAPLLRQPPERWWPAEIDPRAWALDKRLNPSLRANRQPLRTFHPVEAIRTPAFAAIFLLSAAASAIYLGDLAWLATAMLGTDFPHPIIVVAFMLLIGMNGVARAAAGPLSDRLGRRHLLVLVLIIGTAAQFVMIAGARHASPPLLLTGIACAALGAGCCFPLAAALTQDWFGADSTPRNFGIIYTAKSFGALYGIGAIATSTGDPRLLLPAAAAALIAAVIATRLDHPGLPPVRLPGTATRR